MKRNPEATCTNCPYFEADPAETSVDGSPVDGRCRRFPPQFAMATALLPKTGPLVGQMEHITEIVMRAEFPVVRGVLSCGEHPEYLGIDDRTH